MENKLAENIYKIINQYVKTDNTLNDESLTIPKSLLYEIALQSWLLGRDAGVFFLKKEVEHNLESCTEFINQLYDHIKITDNDGNFNK